MLPPKTNELKPGQMCLSNLLWNMALIFGLRLIVPDKSSDFKTAQVKSVIFLISAQGR
jgi:hypothetical protein